MDPARKLQTGERGIRAENGGIPWWIWLIVAVFVIGGIALLFFFLFWGRRGKQPNGSQCSRDEECESGKCSRETNTCIAPDACNGPEDCREGERCEEGRCVSGQCSSNSDCLPNEKCETLLGSNVGSCIPRTCSSTSECDGTAICSDGVCTARKCTNAGFCASNEGCFKGKCTPKVPCTGGRCPEGMKCVGNQCVFCTDNSECETGETCNGGICSYPCSLRGCSEGSICVSQSITKGGQVCCPEGNDFGQPCDSDLGEGKYCVGGTISCVRGRVGDGCISDRDCSTDHCVNTGLRGGVCSMGPECYYKSDCGNPDASFCANGRCSDIMEGSFCIDRSECTDVANGASLNCVNNRCISGKGSYGDLCTNEEDCLGSMICDATSSEFPVKICRLSSLTATIN